jgi:hypothetical protein
MKNLILFIFLTFSFLTFGQKEIKDTSVICFPSEIGREVLKDLNELDRLKTLSILDKKEIDELVKKTNKQDTIIKDLEEKDRNSEVLIKSTEEKYKLIEEDNKDLRDQLKKIKIKNNIIEIVSGFVFATITYIQLFK